MYESVASYLTANLSVVQTIAKFSESLTNFEAAVDAIKAKENERRLSTKGKTEAKYNAEETLLDATIKTASALYTYADLNNNIELRNLADVTYTGLDNLKDVDLIARSEQIHYAANPLAAELADYGLSAADLTAFKTAIDNYSDAAGDRDASVAVRKGASVSIKDMFKNADSILEGQLDKFVDMLMNSYPHFYNGYKGARIIRDLGIRHEEEPASPAQPV